MPAEPMRLGSPFFPQPTVLPTQPAHLFTLFGAQTVVRSPASRPACATGFRIAWADGSNTVCRLLAHP